MNAQVELTVRGPEAYDLAKSAIDSMREHGVWPTPLNFELWLHYVGDPDCPLAKELDKALQCGQPFTEGVAETLANQFLPRSRLSEEIRDAGAVLGRELSAVQTAIDKARQVQIQYGETLADAAERMSGPEAETSLGDVVDILTQATRRIQRHTNVLEKRLESSHTEVSKLREHLEQVRRDAMTDGLTNLANRKAFDEQLNRLCAEADQRGTSLALAVVDIDHFKRFNDNWGHQTGDQVLRYVATALSRMAYPPRVAARYGGEEFALIFPREAAHEVHAALDALRLEISSRALRRRSTNDDLGVVTISAGFALRHPGDTHQQLIERADTALYASKRNGRNQVTCAEDEMSDAA